MKSVLTCATIPQNMEQPRGRTNNSTPHAKEDQVGTVSSKRVVEFDNSTPTSCLRSLSTTQGVKLAPRKKIVLDLGMLRKSYKEKNRAPVSNPPPVTAASSSKVSAADSSVPPSWRSEASPMRFSVPPPTTGPAVESSFLPKRPTVSGMAGWSPWTAGATPSPPDLLAGEFSFSPISALKIEEIDAAVTKAYCLAQTDHDPSFFFVLAAEKDYERIGQMNGTMVDYYLSLITLRTYSLGGSFFVKLPKSLVAETEKFLSKGDWGIFLATLQQSLPELSGFNLEFLRCKGFCAVFRLSPKIAIFMHHDMARNITNLGMVRSEGLQDLGVTRIKLESFVAFLLQFRATTLLKISLHSLPEPRRFYYEIHSSHPDPTALMALDLISRGLSPNLLKEADSEKVKKLVFCELRSRHLLKTTPDLSVPFRLIGPPVPNRLPTW